MTPTENDSATPYLGILKADPKHGGERFTASGKEQEYSVSNFWQWSASDLVSNATRGRLAEFIVAKALENFGVKTNGVVRDEWDSFDLKTADGIRIQVKSSAYLQSWFQNKPSSIIFSTKATRYFDANTGELAKIQQRQADVYIFALLAHKDNKHTLNPLNLDQWNFYVMSTADLDKYPRSKVSITLKSLIDKKTGPVSFADLPDKFKAAISSR